MTTIFKSTGHAQFDKLLEKATSNLLLEPEWASIIQICDLIRQKDCQPKYAVGQLKKKLHHQNPHVSFYALQVLESVVKNCGSPLHEEVAAKQFMEELRELAKTTHHDNIREKILELIQTWAHAFRKIPSYRAVQDTLNIMKTEGAKFPPLVEADAMFVADQAPEWADGECCHRCRVEFSFTQRKHHCRACGQIFCNKCTGKECTLPRFGIEKEVRVCDACFEKYGRDSIGGVSSSGGSSSEEHVGSGHHVLVPSSRGSNGLQKGVLDRSSGTSSVGGSTGASAPGGGGSGDNKPSAKELELAEEEQLQLALAISQSEAEAKEQEMKRKGTGGIRTSSLYSSSNNEPNSRKLDTVVRTTSPTNNQASSPSSEDPELSRYLNRAYWENKSDQQNTAPTSKSTNASSSSSSAPFTPSAPMKLSYGGGILNNTSVSSSSAEDRAMASGSGAATSPPSSTFNKHQVLAGMVTTTATPASMMITEEDVTVDNFMETLRSQIEMFVNRMKSNSSRGRPIANDTSVQSLFMSITHMHSQLLAYIQIQDNARGRYELLQDKLNQVRDARAALDDLRSEHAEAIRRQQEEQERVRQFQMAQKLAMMRQKKNEYLQYQRKLAMERMQEQERQMQMRMAQQPAAEFGPGPHPPGIGNNGGNPPGAPGWGMHNPGYGPVPQQQQPQAMHNMGGPQQPPQPNMYVQQGQWGPVSSQPVPPTGLPGVPQPQGQGPPGQQQQMQPPMMSSPTSGGGPVGVPPMGGGGGPHQMMYSPDPNNVIVQQQQQPPAPPQLPQQQTSDPNMMMQSPQQSDLNVGVPHQQQQMQQVPVPQLQQQQQQVHQNQPQPQGPPAQIAELISFD